MGQLILLRHGQSVWNQENKFTGWTDVALSAMGIQEAILAGQKLESVGIDHVFCSSLKRAIDTAKIALRAAHQENCPMIQNPALNERHYGDLQGLNKAEVAKKYGEDQVKLWRRSFDVCPPNGESLKDTCARVLPYYRAQIEPLLQANKTVLVVAHGNSLRALVKEVEQISDSDIIALEIPTGIPIFYGVKG
ncbi:MAG: 2,3-diphosphoglycerate-dependent phosphoglycerate mutase [Myxococcaceae bacterium]|nr:2,3-diphosphoglycerate-dependent phosphoglycerate mutase [Myxococcaceae bacterium]MBH2006422.1 2,3-diphosphoglycerate-dependent phosphoglycerate mutase [Myxococcaceae bacterium]